MEGIINLIRADQPVLAMKQFRELFGVNLIQAKEIVEALRTVLPESNPQLAEGGRYIVLHRYGAFDEYTLAPSQSKDEAIEFATGIAPSREHTIVARVIAESEAVISLKSVA